MAFIKASVGSGGVNNLEDVKIIQWLLNQAESGYHFMSSLAQEDYNAPGIRETGVVSPSTQIAIDDWSRLCDRIRLPKNKLTIYRGIKIEPDSKYYEKLIFVVARVDVGEKVFANESYNYEDPRVKEALDARITFEQFKFIVEHTKGKMLTALGRLMQQLARQSNIRAFLEVIAFAEGTDGDNDPALSGYSVMMGGTPQRPKLASDLYNHPGGVASGRYQAIPGTWAIAQRVLGLYDFTPESQEIFGAWNISRNKPLILQALNQNNFPAAVEEASTEWASFPNFALTGNDPETNPTSRFLHTRGPNAGKPQRALKLSVLKGIYDTAFKYYQDQNE